MIEYACILHSFDVTDEDGILNCQLQRRKGVSKTESIWSWLLLWMLSLSWLPVRVSFNALS